MELKSIRSRVTRPPSIDEMGAISNCYNCGSATSHNRPIRHGRQNPIRHYRKTGGSGIMTPTTPCTSSILSESTEITIPAVTTACCARKKLPTNGVNWQTGDSGPCSAGELLARKKRRRENYERAQFNKGQPISTVPTPEVRNEGTNIRDKRRIVTTFTKMSKQAQYDKKWFEPPKCCTGK